jgi:hypothetical protein
MSAVSAAFGFRPAYCPSGLARPRKYTIASGYATGIQSGSPVMLEGTGGTVTIGGTTGDLLGIFAGCEYVDSTGKPTVSNQWIAGTTVLAGTTVTAWVFDGFATVFEVQSVGSVTQANIGEECNTTAISGSTFTGLSSTTAAAPNGTTQSQWRIIGFGQQIDNAPGDAFTIIQVTLAQSQLAFANKVGV